VPISIARRKTQGLLDLDLVQTGSIRIWFVTVCATLLRERCAGTCDSFDTRIPVKVKLGLKAEINLLAGQRLAVYEIGQKPGRR
jgi:hypothetical protein